MWRKQPFVSAVSVSQFDQHTVRVVLDLTAQLPELPLQTTGSDMEFVLRSEISRISLVATDDRMAVVVEGKGSLDPQILRLRDPERVVIDIPNAWPTETFDEITGAGLVRKVRAAQFTPQVYRVVAELTSPATVRFLRVSREVIAVLIEPPTLTDVRIAVDAGHGGFDPGAVGRVLGLHEADVNLDIAKRLLALLNEAEALPLMVRPDEQFIPLIDRPLIAANHDAAIFVSIHCNSSSKDEGSGTETLYYDPDNGSLKLAISLQEELVKALGTRDRGVKQRRLYVLTSSDIPAALVEVAFLVTRTKSVSLPTKASGRKQPRPYTTVYFDSSLTTLSYILTQRPFGKASQTHLSDSICPSQKTRRMKAAKKWRKLTRS